jgi:hypothetical protein
MLNARSGAIEWQFSYGVSSPSSVPTLAADAETVYVSTDDLKFRAINTTSGELVWEGTGMWCGKKKLFPRFKKILILKKKYNPLSPAGRQGAMTVSTDSSITMSSASATLRVVPGFVVLFEEAAYTVDELAGLLWLPVSVIRSGRDTVSAFTVNVTAVDQSATLGADFSAPARTQTLVFASGQAKVDVNVAITRDGDTDGEPNESFELRLLGLAVNGTWEIEMESARGKRGLLLLFYFFEGVQRENREPHERKRKNHESTTTHTLC